MSMLFGYRGPGPPCGVVFLTLLFVLHLTASVTAEKSKYYSMQSLCKNHFLQQLYRKIDGAVLWSQNERNLDCFITFQTHSILQRFMLRFDFLQLDCNDHLYIYDGAHAVGTYKFDLSCKNTKQNLGAMFTRTNYVTLKYVTDAWGTESNGFKLVITAVKDPKHACTEFRCNLREFCIATDLVCDNVNHCADGSDELSPTVCQNTESSTILGMELTWFVATLIMAVLVLLVCIVGIAICICRWGWNGRMGNGNVQQQNASYSLYEYQRASAACWLYRRRFPPAYVRVKRSDETGEYDDVDWRPGKLVAPCGPARVPPQQQQHAGPGPPLLPGKLRSGQFQPNGGGGPDKDHVSQPAQKDEWFV